ncbi:MAG: cytochrome c biogenesis protein ResB [Phycisphaerales bacterium]
MKKTHPWHGTAFGKAARFLGSIELAVPVLFFSAAAIAWATFVESTQDAKAAKAMVYGSWWFIGLMVLICVSLVFAVVVRYPWKRRHVGFIVVHASLITVIAGGFWSLFGRIEGHLPLEEGTASDVIETDREQLALVRHDQGQFTPLEEAGVPRNPSGALEVGGVRVHVLERWANTREERYIADDAPEPYRAIEIAAEPGAMAGDWIGEEEASGGPALLAGVRVRVLPDGANWEPPAPGSPGVEEGFAFVLGSGRHPLGEAGREAVPGWTITSVKRFASALVGTGGLTQNPAGGENPAVEVVISDGKGTTERHTSFMKFPDMIMAKALEGTAASGARLTATPPGGGHESLVVYGPVSAPQFGYIAPDGSAQRLGGSGPFPRVVEAGSRRFTVFKQVSRARPASRFVKAPPAKEHRPALLVRVGDSTELTVLAWKDMAAAPVTWPGGGQVMLRYGPGMVKLPFSVKLVDFRKRDYPGTEMAMAYESDVGVTRPGEAEQTYLVYMNNPYIHGPWRVYQSGFMGENISIFSVMRDPGLPLTYVGATGLCLGILITFYSRSLSWGHPGIPIEFASKETKESADGPNQVPARRADRAGGVPVPAGAGV